jgi:hypothetical protein
MSLFLWFIMWPTQKLREKDKNIDEDKVDDDYMIGILTRIWKKRMTVRMDNTRIETTTTQTAGLSIPCVNHKKGNIYFKGITFGVALPISPV